MIDRAEVLTIYRESILHENIVKLIFDTIMDLSLSDIDTILIPDCADGTVVRILQCCGYSGKIYVTEQDKARRAGLHRMRIKIIDDRAIGDIDIMRSCGSYRKYPECIGCPVDKAECSDYGVNFDTAIVLREYTKLHNFVGSVIVIDSRTELEYSKLRP